MITLIVRIQNLAGDFSELQTMQRITIHARALRSSETVPDHLGQTLGQLTSTLDGKGLQKLRQMVFV